MSSVDTDTPSIVKESGTWHAAALCYGDSGEKWSIVPMLNPIDLIKYLPNQVWEIRAVGTQTGYLCKVRIEVCSSLKRFVYESLPELHVHIRVPSAIATRSVSLPRLLPLTQKGTLRPFPIRRNTSMPGLPSDQPVDFYERMS